MSEMIERVAKAMAKVDADNSAWKLYVREARAAIEAMRDPTEAMLDAGMKGAECDLTSEWQYMIDEALGLPQAERKDAAQ